VSHDLAVVSSIADRVAVMYAGRIVEVGPTGELLRHPRHPYTLALVESVPDHETPRVLHGVAGIAVAAWEADVGCAFASRCRQAVELCTEQVPALETVGPGRQARCLRWQVTPSPEELSLRSFGDAHRAAGAVLAVHGLRASHDGGKVVAARDVSFSVERGDCLALVGESGSGKTTVARCIVGLHAPDAGQVLLGDQVLPALAHQRTLAQRRTLQIVFQNPYDSLNPRRTVEEAIARPLELFRTGGRGDVAPLLELVRLPARLAQRFPHELSGGERQRVAIARALAARPSVVVCDEITSALDVSVQAVVIDLLWELRRSLGLALVLITHDLGVVASVADDVVVLERGEVRETGSVETLLHAPEADYTRRLLAAAPSIERGTDNAIAIGR
jgi:peptide/nickel transport system ATP-binding protein